MNKIVAVLIIFFYFTTALFAVPNNPSDLNLKATATTVQIKWKDNSDNETGFKIFRDDKLIDIVPPNVTYYEDTNLIPATTYKYTIKATDDQNITALFQKRFVYFDRDLFNDQNYETLKKVIKRAREFGFNGLVLAQEYIFNYLSHKNEAIKKMRERFSEIESIVHENGMELVLMHFSAEVPNTIVRDADPNNQFYRAGIDLSEANSEKTLYKVQGDKAVVDTQTLITKSEVEKYYYEVTIKANREYALVLNATTENHPYRDQKISILDTTSKGNGKVIFGIHKYFHNIEKDKKDTNYTIYFNSLDHFEDSGKVRIFIPHEESLKINYITLKESGYQDFLNVKRPEHEAIVTDINASTIYEEGTDYVLHDGYITLLSDEIKENNKLKVKWYPRINVSRPDNHLPKADACAQNGLFFEIMKDQYNQANSAFNNKIDSVALFIDEWREAGWNKKCIDFYKDYKQGLTTDFTGGEYIGITTAKMIDEISSQMSNKDKAFYLMSDMFDPNFNAVNPYMGVRGGAEGATQYLPANRVVIFNWLPNPKEPGLEKKTLSDFLASGKYFASHGMRQIIAGYHDDMNNLDANVAFYKAADEETKKSIIGFMFLIWHRPGKNGTYDDMYDVVKRLCKDLPGKWPKGVCKALN